MKLIRRLILFLRRIQLLSVFIGLILIFFVFTLITYHYINGNFGDKRFQSMVSMIETEESDVSDHLMNKISRVHNYCNPITTIGLNEELLNISSVIPDLSLIKVFVVIRHGDRGPLRPVRDMSSITFDPMISFDSNNNNYKNLFKGFLIETKDRLRRRKLSVTYSLTAETSGIQLGQLSRFGSVQHLTLGSVLSKLYKTQLNLTSNQMKVYSTPYSRTFQSAVAFVYGFLRPKSVIDFNTFPKIFMTFGTFFCSSSEYCAKSCKKVDFLQKIIDENKRKTLSSHPAVINLLDEIKPIIARNVNETKIFESPVALFDGLMAYLCHNTPLPCDDKRCISVSDVKQLVSYIDFNNKQLVLSEVFKHLNWIKIYGFFNHLIETIKDYKRNHRFILYSGHDITIAALASALDFFDGTLPPYASRVIFEVFKHKTIDEMYLRIIYNGKDVTHLTEICKLKATKCLGFQSKHKISLISVKDFNEFVLQKFKSITQTTNYQKACNSS